MDSEIVDTWTVVEHDIAMRTSVVAGGKFVTVERMIKMGNDAPEMAVIPLSRGDELGRLIAALQRARDGETKAELTSQGTPLPANSLLLSNVVELARRLLHVEGRTLSIGIIILVLFVLFVGSR
jgi:hypothetical protein